jgi:hypothetical protein
MFYRLSRGAGRLMFNAFARDVLATRPLSMVPAPLVLLSQVCHRDLLPYLVAVKSLYRRLGEGEVVVVDDGTLDEADKAHILWHLPLSSIVPLAAIDTGRCPRGGTWERLLAIVDRSAEAYVIQVDSDTVTAGAIPEVVAAYRANRSFTLGTDIGQAAVPVAEIKTFPHDSICCLAERMLSKLPEAGRLRYVHGSSGFAGFARGAFSRGAVEAFSDAMRGLLGDRWDEWGSEQVASNFLVANAPDAVVLPYRRYACFEPWLDRNPRAFLHFYGTYRYKGGIYAAAARQAISALA